MDEDTELIAEQLINQLATAQSECYDAIASIEYGDLETIESSQRKTIDELRSIANDLDRIAQEMNETYEVD